ncbi:uncharacterized protein CLUP02_16645, partial [Colletotrichum lupini]
PLRVQNPCPVLEYKQIPTTLGYPKVPAPPKSRCRIRSLIRPRHTADYAGAN